MAAEDLNLSGVKTLEQAMARTKNGPAAIELARRMGLWTESAHAQNRTRASFPPALSDLTPAQLSDLNATWTGEFGRILEVYGAVEAQIALTKLQIKRAQASARARAARAQEPGAKAMTQSALNDLAEEDAGVIDLQDQLGLLMVLESHVSAAKEATDRYLASISREISFRDAQMKARIY